MNDTNKTLTEKEQEGHYKTYSDYATVLRAWFVAYGIGGPVLFLTQSDIADAISESGRARFIIVLFLLGVSSQVFIALVNQWVNWYLYFDPDPAKSKHKRRRAKVDALSKKFLLDVACDIFSVVAFGWATVSVLLIFA